MLYTSIIFIQNVTKILEVVRKLKWRNDGRTDGGINPTKPLATYCLIVLLNRFVKIAYNMGNTSQICNEVVNVQVK